MGPLMQLTTYKSSSEIRLEEQKRQLDLFLKNMMIHLYFFFLFSYSLSLTYLPSSIIFSPCSPPCLSDLLSITKPVGKNQDLDFGI